MSANPALPTIAGNMKILNIAAYRFVALDDLAALQAALRQQLVGRAVMGTVLLAEEGINLFSGARP